MTKIVKMPSVKNESIVSVEVSGAFMQRIQGLYFHYLKLLGEKNVEKALEIIKSKQVDKAENLNDAINSFNIETFLIWIQEIEAEFEKKGLIFEEEIKLEKVDTNED